MPQYDLEQLVAAARARQIIYGGRKVHQDIANLGYSLNEVAICIQQLRADNFQKTWCNDDNTAIFDVYKIEFSPQDGQNDSIYMKLRLLDNGQVFVGLGSFHLA